MKIKKVVLLGAMMAMFSLFQGCAHSPQTAPCPGFGASCTQTPINSWNTNY